MKRNFMGKFLGLTLAAVMAVSSSVPSLAAEELSEFASEEAVYEEVLEEIPEEENEEPEAEAEEDYQEPEDTQEEESEDVQEEEPAEEEAVADEAVLTEEPEQDPAEEPSLEPEEESTWANEEYTFVYHDKTKTKDYQEKKTYTFADKDQELAASFIKTGYKITGWTYKYAKGMLESGATVDDVVALADANKDAKIDLYTNWDQIQYSIVFYGSDGKQLEFQPEGYTGIKYTDSVDFTSAAKQISKTLPEGVAVVGFSKSNTGKVEYALGKKFSKLMNTEGEIVLYPVQGAGEYSINYELEDGELSKEVISYMPGKRVVLPTAKKTGYRFLGWEPEDDIDSTIFETKTVKDYDGEKHEVVVALKKTAKSAINLKAIFEPIRFTLYIDPNGKGVVDGETALKKQMKVGVFDYEGTLREEGKYLPESPEKRGSIFIGFSLDPKATAEKGEFVSGDDLSALTTKKSATLYCIWEKIPYEIMYLNEVVIIDSKSFNEEEKLYDYSFNCIDEEAGEFAKVETIYYGSSYSLKPIQIPGCTFMKWAVEELNDASLVVDKNTGKVSKVKADNESSFVVRGFYTENACKIKFNTNGGTYTENKVTKKGAVSLIEGYAKPFTNPDEIYSAMDKFENGLSRTGYTLKGLYLDAKGKKPVPADLRGLSKKLNGTVTIYAVWQKGNAPKNVNSAAFEEETSEEETPGEETPGEETPGEENPAQTATYNVKFHIDGLTFTAAVEYDSKDPEKQSTIEDARLIAAKEDDENYLLKWIYKNGYDDFWFYDEACTQEADMKAVVSDNLELFGKWVNVTDWEDEVYTFVFHENNGGKNRTVKKTYNFENADDIIGEGTESFSKKGYTLDGWRTKDEEWHFEKNSTATELIGFAHRKTLHLYAEWKPISYTMKFYYSDGKEFETQPTHCFEYFSTEPVFSYEDVIDFTAAADYLNDYYDAGTAIVGFSKTMGGKADFAVGKKYRGCYDKEGELALYAVTKTKTYPISYYTDGGELTKPVNYYKAGKRVVLPKAVKPGYVFKGWHGSEDEDNIFEKKKYINEEGDVDYFVTAIKSKARTAVYLEAVYELAYYDISVAPNAKGVTYYNEPFKKKLNLGIYSGEGDRVDVKASFSKAGVARKGYEFVGLSLNPKATTEDECIFEDDYSWLTDKSKATLYCIWAKKEYHLSQDLEALIISPESSDDIEDTRTTIEYDLEADATDLYSFDQSIYYGKKYKLNSLPNLVGADFVGYVLGESDCEGTPSVKYKEKYGYKTVTQINADNEADITVIPVFLQKYYTLTFDTNGGVYEDYEGTKTGKVSVLEGYAFPVTDYQTVEMAVEWFIEGVSREGYTLKGLSLDPKGKKPLPADLRTLGKKYKDEVTVYAVWEKAEK